MNDSVFRLADELGPARILHICDPRVGLKGILVVDNVAAGPAIGGIRMARDVTLEECARLARAMTLKNAAAGLPHGGGKSVIVGDPKLPQSDKERIIRAFAAGIRGLADYIPGPDMGTDERCMAWTKDEIGRSVGLPPELGGIPLDQIGATGFGLAVAAEVAQGYGGPTLKGARVAVQGFGSVGQHAARFLADKGAALVATADSKGTLVNRDGLDIAKLIELKRAGRSVTDYGGGQKLGPDAIVGVDCDVWIPAARPDVIDIRNVGQLKARLVLQGANIPVTTDAETALHQRKILTVPDFIANAGGVICAAVEYRGGTEAQAFQAIAEKIRANTAAVLEEATKSGVMPRKAAVALAHRRVETAMTYRRFA